MKRSTPARLLIVIVAAAFISTGIASAQQPDISQGADPSAVYLGTDYEHVETRTGRVYLNIPLLADHSQRGDLNFSYHVVWGGLGAWLTACVKVYNGYQCHYGPSNYSGSTSMGPSPIMDGGLAQESTNPPPKTFYLPISSSDGSSHIAQPVLGQSPSYGETTDGTGIQVPPTCAQYRCIVNNRGDLFSEQNGSGAWLITDRNGNQMSLLHSGTLGSDFGPQEFGLGTQGGFTYAWTMTDTVGRKWSFAPASNTSGCPSSVGADHATIWITPGPNGGTRSFEFCYSKISISTSLPSYSSVYHANVSQFVANLDFLTAIILPDGTNWQFQYNDSYGDLTKLTLPTGGTISYQYTTTVDPYLLSTSTFLRTLSSRTISDGTNSNTWAYALSQSNNVVTYTMTDPFANDTLYSTPLTVFVNAQTQYYVGSASNGTLLKTLSMTYLKAPNGTGPCWLPDLPLTTTTTWPNGQTSSVSLTYDSGFKFACYTVGGYAGQSTNSVYGVVTSKTETDYGGATLRQTQTEYEWQVNSSFLTANLLSFPYQVGVTGSGGTASVGCFFGTAQSCTTYGYDGIGNETSVTQLLNTGSSPVTQHAYNSYGMRTSMTDARNNTTNYKYDSTGVCVNEIDYPTPSSGVAQIEHFACDPNTEQITQHTDRNGNPTTYSYDNMLRPLAVNYPDKGQTTVTYVNPNELYTTETMDTSGDYRRTFIAFDGLGRKNRVAVTNGEANPYDETQNTCFNSVGLVSSQGYPFQDGGWNNPISCSVAGDSYIYDALGRPTKVTHVDGSYASTSYSGNSTTVTDEQGKTRESFTDGLGRLTSVIENPGGLNYTTTYAYDALDNLTSVVQNSSRIRTFVYDSLSRLTSAANPESGTTSYTYDADSNLATRTDARNITTTYSYDSLNRLTSKTYSDGTPGAYFYYDQSSWAGTTLTNGIGRVTSQGVFNGTNWLASSGFSYDPMGRAINNPQWTAMINTTLQVPYTYDLIGDMTTYGNGGASWLTFTQSFNVGGRVTQLTSNWVDSQHPATLASGIHYIGNGAVAQMTYGNGLTGTNVYNSRLQPCLIDVNSAGKILQTCNDSTPTGNVLDLAMNYNFGSSDNGNVVSWNATNATATPLFLRTYTYDALNRLSAMSDSASGATCKGLSWTYDAWGNRTDQTVTSGTCNTFHQSVDGNNRLLGSPYQYDAAGNMIHDASHSYTYDAENRITRVDGGSTATYGYDVDGRRVNRVVAGVETDYIYDLSGRVVADYGGGCGATCWRVGYVYLNGEVVAEYFGGTYFVHTDHLGSTRLLTGYPTASVVECDDYYPFGEQISCGGTSTTTHKFTGKERDSESALDNFGARYDSSAMGRFMSPDPAGQDAANPAFPQTWNLYSYVRNNPLNATDPDGLDCIYIDSHNAGNSYVQGGDCTSDTDNGIFVNGHIDSFTYDPSTGQFGYSFSNAEEQTGGGGVLSLNNSDAPDPLLLAVAQGTQMSRPIVEPAFWATMAFVTMGMPMLEGTSPEILGLGTAAHPSAPLPTNPAQAPGPGWEWRGSGAPGSSQGSWYNPSTRESLHPDFQNPAHFGPHWDYTNSGGQQFRVYPNGMSIPKQ